MTTTTQTASIAEKIVRVIVPPMTLMLAIGTGGANTPEYCRVRDARLYVHSGQDDRSARETINVATAADDLARITSILKLSTTELAQTLGVSRQAIYNWKAGSHIKSHNVAKLENLKKAADAIVGARITMSPLLLDRKLTGGKTLLETIADGGNGGDAANALLRLLQDEAHQRESIDRMLADREHPMRDVSEYGVPSFNEG